MALHEKRFPAEPEAYRAARDELLRAELRLREEIERVAALRRALPMGGALRQDYVFEGAGDSGAAEPVRLSELFAPGKDSLVIYSLTFGAGSEQPSASGASLIDGLNAVAPHVTDRVNLAVVAPTSLARLLEVAQARGWTRLPLLSSASCDYGRDYWAEDDAGNAMPMLNVFVRRPGGVHHFWGSELLYVETNGEPRHVDLIWPLWNLFDLTPEGRGQDWRPKRTY